MPFEKGQSGNPAGRPSGKQSFADRATRFLEEYTIDELIELAQNKVAFGKLCVLDGMIVRRLVVALTKGGGTDMDRILDRVMGRPMQTTELRTAEPTLAELVACARRELRSEAM